jgi:hypothetical protein
VTGLAQGFRIWLIVAAAAMLLANSLVASLASSRAAETVVDAFGNPLCITNSDSHAAAPAGDHSKLPDCCTLGCTMGSSALAARHAIETAPVVWPQNPEIARRDEDPAPLRAPDYDPGNPRAPPLTA